MKNEASGTFAVRSRLTCARQRWPAVRLALELGAEVDAVDEDGNTALHWAAKEGKLDCARLLVAADADRTKTNKAGKTALDIAKQKGEAAKEIVALLEDGKGLARTVALQMHCHADSR